jgi:hypothetical protein
LLAKADSAADGGQHSIAIDLYDSALASKGLPGPIKSAVAFNLGLSLKQTAAWPRARRAFEAALALLPAADGRRKLLHRHLGEVCAAVADWGAAAEHFSVPAGSSDGCNNRPLVHLDDVARQAGEAADKASLFRSLGAVRLNAGDANAAVTALEIASACAASVEVAAPSAVQSDDGASGVSSGAYYSIAADLGVALALLGRTREAEDTLRTLLLLGSEEEGKKDDDAAFSSADRTSTRATSAPLNAYVGLRLHDVSPALARLHLEAAIAAGIAPAGTPAGNRGGAGSNEASGTNGINANDSSSVSSSSSRRSHLARAVYDRLARMYAQDGELDVAISGGSGGGGSSDSSGRGGSSGSSDSSGSSVTGGGGMEVAREEDKGDKKKGKERAAELVSEAVARGVWRRSDQRPGYLAARPSLLAQPWWHHADDDHDDDHDDDDGIPPPNVPINPIPLPPALARTVQLLQGNASAIRAELLAALPSLVSDKPTAAAPVAAAAVTTTTTTTTLPALGSLQIEDDASSPRGSTKGVIAAVALSADDEHVADAGKWEQLVFVRNGCWLPPTPPPAADDLPAKESVLAEEISKEETCSTNCGNGGNDGGNGSIGPRSPHDLFPTTTAVLREIQKVAAFELPKGSMQFSILQPGTHLRPHCGPTNHKLRVHLGLVVPSASSLSSSSPGRHQEQERGQQQEQGQDKEDDEEEEGGGAASKSRKAPANSARMRVGDVMHGWKEGGVVVFDDSFEHEVWNDDGRAPRVVLLLDVWHPDLSEAEREVVRRDFEQQTTTTPQQTTTTPSMSTQMPTSKG